MEALPPDPVGERERHVPAVQEEEFRKGHAVLLRVRVAAHAAKPASNWSRSIDATTTEPFKAPRRESPILKRAASEFMKNFRRKPFGDASNKQPAPPAGAPQKKPQTAR